jgi:glutamyl/glutaminyl-tRNA synthetase
MKVPREGVCQVQDMLRGQIEIEWDQVDMQVLLKATACRPTTSPTWSMTT